jgi:hypothetical protein
MAVRLSALRAGRTLPPRRDPVDLRDILRLEELPTLKKIPLPHRIRTRDLPAYNTALHPPTLQRAHLIPSSGAILRHTVFGIALRPDTRMETSPIQWSGENRSRCNVVSDDARTVQ